MGLKQPTSQPRRLGSGGSWVVGTGVLEGIRGTTPAQYLFLQALLLGSDGPARVGSGLRSGIGDRSIGDAASSREGTRAPVQDGPAPGLARPLLLECGHQFPHFLDFGYLRGHDGPAEGNSVRALAGGVFGFGHRDCALMVGDHLVQEKLGGFGAL